MFGELVWKPSFHGLVLCTHGTFRIPQESLALSLDSVLASKASSASLGSGISAFNPEM
jgi:hypothetical protein